MIRDAVAHKHGVQIGYEVAKKAKKLALGDDLQSQAAQFAKLPTYADVIRTADPEAIATLTMEEHDGIQRFHRFFVCPGVSRSAFEHCRFFLAMDGTFTKSCGNAGHPYLKKLKGRPQTARITAGEQRARRAAHAGALPDIPNRIQQRGRPQCSKLPCFSTRGDVAVAQSM